MHAHAQRLDPCLEGLAALVVELYRHQAWGELHHMGIQAKGLQRIGRFQAEQATAHHHATARVGRRRADGVEVAQGAIDQP
ncbi:hypothetical protein D3C72_2186180 [compost metagenome]